MLFKLRGVYCLLGGFFMIVDGVAILLADRKDPS